MTEEAPAGFVLDLQDGVELRAQHVPGHKNPYLGIRQGNQFIALAAFISDAEMEFLKQVLSARVFVIQPMELATEDGDRLD